MANLWLIGCTHFGHENIIKLANRPFSNIKEMNEAIISNWNDVVHNNDTVYHLGDFSFKGGHYEEYAKKLNGNMIEIRGNHDKKFGQYDMLELYVNDRKVILCHYPIEEWNGYYRNSVHFHCHTHKKDFISAERRGNVGVDAIGFKPINIEDAIGRLYHDNIKKVK